MSEKPRVYVLTIAHEDPYNVDPERPRVFATPERVAEYLTVRDFVQSDDPCVWEHEDPEGFLTTATVHRLVIRS